MSNKAAYNREDPTVKQTFTVQTSLLERAKERAKSESGGNLSRYIQSLIEADLSGPKTTATGDGSRVIAELAEKWRPDVAEEVEAAAAKCEKQSRLLGLILAAIPHFVKAWDKDNRNHPCPPDVAPELYLIPGYSANELREYLDQGEHSYARFFEQMRPRMTETELQIEAAVRSTELRFTRGDARSAYYLPKMRSAVAPDEEAEVEKKYQKWAEKCAEMEAEADEELKAATKKAAGKKPKAKQ